MLTLLSNTIAVLYIGDPEKTSGGLYIPDVAKERADQGIVKYVGKDVKDVKVGDYVVFSGWTGTVIHMEGEGGMIILPEDQVECIVHPDATEIPGLYHMSREGGFFPATYESATSLLRERFWELPRKLNLKNRK
jgi:chaperonin GroES